MLEQKNDLERKGIKRDYELKILKKQLELKSDLMTKNEMDKKVRETVSTISRYTSTPNAKLVNIDAGGLAGGAGEGDMQNMMGNMLVQYQAISNATN